MFLPRPGRAAALLTSCLAALALAACAGLLGPRTIEIDQERLQQAVARQFPLKGRVVQVLDLDVSVPRLTMRPETNRVGTDFDVTLGETLLKKPLRGSIGLSYGLRYEASDHTVRLTDLRVERLELLDGGDAVKRQLDSYAPNLGARLLGDPVVYTLTERDLANVQGRGLQPGEIRVTPRGLAITLVPSAS